MIDNSSKNIDIEFLKIASECEENADYNGMFNAISEGLAHNPFNYELYFTLGFYYLQRNVNQAYLCFQNALFYCLKELDINPCQSLVNDKLEIEAAMSELIQSSDFQVKDTAIIIVSYNSIYLQQKNIESIRNTLLPGSYNIIVVDNASEDGCKEWLAGQSDITLIANSHNVGFAPACNQGAYICGDKDIFLLNNDTRLSPNSLFWLKMGLYESDSIGATGAVSNYAGNNQQIDLSFNLPDEYTKYGMQNNIPMPSPYEYRVRLSGFAMLIKAGLWSMVGGMDEDFAPGYFEDDDLSMKLMKAGFRLLLCKNSFIYHAGSQSFSRMKDTNELLLSHHNLFKSKYGFDILSHCEPNYNRLLQLSYSRDDEFNLLVIGSGLGADMLFLSDRFPHANIIGFEKSQSMWEISSKSFVVFNTAEELNRVLGAAILSAVIITPAGASQLTEADLPYINALLMPDCKIISNDNTTIPFEKIKMVIWDLDETFWSGTLSEEEIREIPSNTALIVALSDCGIVNSISSKNDEYSALAALNRMDITGAFVFNNINWQPKGPQIRQKIASMNLRAENVLFIDDNPRNLEEARHFCPDIMIAGPNIIPALAQYVSGLHKNDRGHTRLSQYKLLEKKLEAKEKSSSPVDFLYESNIRICIEYNCSKYIDRIFDLVKRSNQLNYTKIRSSKDELLEFINNSKYQTGCVFASDNYGNYGIIGFFCLNITTNQLVHFLFSCRTMGMGIEQYIYSYLSFPKVAISKPVSVELSPNFIPGWIKLSSDSYMMNESSNKAIGPRVLLKGPCDMDSIAPLLTECCLTTEFNFVNSLSYITTGHNHTVNLVDSLKMSDAELKELVSTVPFLTMGDFDTSLFTDEFDVICFSLLPDCSSGLYQRKSDGKLISFGNRNYDLTLQQNYQGLCDGSLPGNMFPFTPHILTDFAKEWLYIGETPPELLVKNLDLILSSLKGTPKIVLTMGSELEYTEESEEFKNAALIHQKINPVIKAWAKDKSNVILINLTDFISSTDDYLDCVNHFKKHVYVSIANRLKSIICET